MLAPISRSSAPANAKYYRHLLWLGGGFGVLTVILGIAPWHRQDWILENALVAAALLVLLAIYRYLPFSRLSWTLVFLFLGLHEVGAHYTYSEVPYQVWWQQLTGAAPAELAAGGRNHFDRAIHFCYGFLLAYPIREIFLRLARARGFWSYFLPLDLTLSTSALYELIEWGAAELVGGELGIAYLGTQGDPWDAQKDMAMAALGALIALGITFAVNCRYQRDFAREWAESLRIWQEEEANAPPP